MKNRDFRISLPSRESMTLSVPVFETDDEFLKIYRQSQEIAALYNSHEIQKVSAGKLHASAILHLIYETVINEYLLVTETNPFSRISVLAEKNEDCQKVLNYYNKMFPSVIEDEYSSEELLRAFFVHQVYRANPALLSAMKKMTSEEGMNFPSGTKALNTILGGYLKGSSATNSSDTDLFSFLTKPARLHPDSLTDQINYILEHWQYLLPESLKLQLLKALDFISEETKPHFSGNPDTVQAPVFDNCDIESFTKDQNWMPNVVMIAKSTLVWLDQLSKKYGRDISTLDRIPDEELDILKERGFTALWLIGLWERSPASKRIKNLCGNPDAESSAYSLKGYNISQRIGGWQALDNLRNRCASRGIRLASDMVPNHTGLDSDWIKNHSDYFVQQSYPPFPSYSYTGENLSQDPSYEIRIEDHYFNRTDAAVTFQKKDNITGQVSYIFHGNDGTTMPWNDTAQLDFLNPQTREAVIQQILEVARNFHIIRFDAAMTLAKRHIQRLWYPKPGTGGDIAGRTPYGMSDEEFNRRIPVEFWREVVDRIAQEVPDTLLLAEAFWMMEGYFVRTLGMHRVYNSAFMHMLKNQDNRKYIDSIKSTLVYDPEILKRYVNFMNNPDEDTAIAQFGNSDKYFGVCTVLATMPGLPMFGHGQIEGFREKYGMEYQRAYWDEKPDEGLINEHKRRIFPLLKLRNLFSGCDYFQQFDAYSNGQIQDSLFAYTNGDENQMTLVLYNNRYEHAEGTIFTSSPKLVRNNDNSRHTETITLAQSLRLNRKVRRFMIYRTFPDNLTYIVPSVKIFEEGYYVSLNGYETKVLLGIHEVEDVDGMYEKLCNRLNGKGVQNLDFELNLLYLEPFFEVAEPLQNQKFSKDLKTLLVGRASSVNIKNIMQTLGSYYVYLDEISELVERFGLNYKSVTSSDILDLLNRIDNLCKIEVFTNGNLIMDSDLAVIAATAFIIRPFVNANTTIKDAVKIIEKLKLARFFDCSESLVAKASILVLQNTINIETLLNDEDFCNLAGANEYKGITWYRGEDMQDCLYLANLADAINSASITDPEIFEDKLRIWLVRNSEAGYRLDNLRKESKK